MKIKSVLNNSALISLNEKNEEIILIGSGISFQKHPGDLVDESRIEKQFKMYSESANNLIELLNTIPEKYFEVTNVIVRYANKKLKNALDKNVYVTLFDHINSTIERYEKGINLEFGLLNEIQMLYPEIYMICVWSLDYLNATFDIDLNEDEAGFLAVHFLNALRDSDNLKNAKRVMNIVHDILDVIEKQYPTIFKLEGMNYARAVTHFKYLAVRYLNHKLLDDLDLNEDFITISGLEKNEKITACVISINEMMKEKYGAELTKDEIYYLYIHMHRLLK